MTNNKTPLSEAATKVRNDLRDHDYYGNRMQERILALPEPYQEAIRFVASDDFASLISTARQRVKETDREAIARIIQANVRQSMVETGYPENGYSRKVPGLGMDGIDKAADDILAPLKGQPQ